MNIFITGATGVLGRTVTRLLVDSGHTVRALARNSNSETRLRDAGVQPLRVSLFDPPSLRTAVRDCDAILHLATRIPAPADAPRREAWKENDRIRAEGTRNLVDAALEARVSTLLYPGIVFVYPDRGAAWLDESTPTSPTATLQSSLKAEGEVERFTREGNRGIVLRMGGFYGPTAGSSKNMLRMAKYGFATFFGRSNAYQPLIWVDDAALAVFDALGKASAGIYNIVDDEPMQKRELARALADSLDRRWLLRPPRLYFRVMAGRHAMFMTRSQRVSNQKFRNETGWTPMIASAKVGFRLLSIPP
jgi:nucleoside-diphosphate-sugar epimerase